MNPQAIILAPQTPLKCDRGAVARAWRCGQSLVTGRGDGRQELKLATSQWVGGQPEKAQVRPPQFAGASLSVREGPASPGLAPISVWVLLQCRFTKVSNMELRCSYLPAQVGRYCCSWAGKQPETVFKPKTEANRGLSRRLSEGLFWESFRYSGVGVADSGLGLETARYATAREHRAALPPFQHPPSLPSTLLKLALFYWKM